MLETVGFNKGVFSNMTCIAISTPAFVTFNLAGLDLIDIQRQCRHESPTETATYMKKLGLLRSKDHFSKIKAIGSR